MSVSVHPLLTCGAEVICWGDLASGCEVQLECLLSNFSRLRSYDDIWLIAPEWTLSLWRHVMTPDESCRMQTFRQRACSQSIYPKWVHLQKITMHFVSMATAGSIQRKRMLAILLKHTLTTTKHKQHKAFYHIIHIQCSAVLKIWNHLHVCILYMDSHI